MLLILHWPDGLAGVEESHPGVIKVILHWTAYKRCRTKKKAWLSWLAGFIEDNIFWFAFESNNNNKTIHEMCVM